MDHADPELRREVESLLTEQGGNHELLNRPAMDVAADLLQQASLTGFAPGIRIGPYKIEKPLGKGGMGEVYRAKDTKLGREVAIKVLPRALAGDPERMARFEREAKVLAALNHPNIATIYAVEESPREKLW